MTDVRSGIKICQQPSTITTLWNKEELLVGLDI